jgi:hypothetical protein
MCSRLVARRKWREGNFRVGVVVPEVVERVDLKADEGMSRRWGLVVGWRGEGGRMGPDGRAWKLGRRVARGWIEGKGCLPSVQMV